MGAALTPTPPDPAPDTGDTARCEAAGELARLRTVLDEVARNLAGVCVFWACPGPDAPFTPMATCVVCASVIAIRHASAA